MPEEIEEDLLTRIFEALVDLGRSVSRTEAGLGRTSSGRMRTLRDLIVSGKIPDTVAVVRH